jgi:2-polyprenyl-3-methyl-5-hydroxy-6-metoxy-1,4-benzoquinol methylase
MSSFYNHYHKKNRNVQTRVISKTNYTYQTILGIIAKHFNRSGAVLDIGCGVGTTSLYLASLGFEVTGIDISDKAIALAKKSNKELGLGVQFAAGDVMQLNYKNKFDYAICSEVIEHVPDDKKLVGSIYTLLKKDGVLVLSTPLDSAPLYRWGTLQEFDKEVGHLRRYSKHSITLMLKNAGFSIVETKETEGLLRNFLFTNNTFGFLLKFARWPLVFLFNFFDQLLLRLFGASDIYVVARKQ